MNYMIVFVLIVAVPTATWSASTTISPLRFFLRNVFKSGVGRNRGIMDSGIVEPSEITKKPGWFDRKKTTPSTLDLDDFLSNSAASEEDADDLIITSKPKGILANLFRRMRTKSKGDDEDRGDVDKESGKSRPSFLSNALRALRDSSRRSWRNIFQSLFPALFASST